jgi:TrmH family RNA methyltransferase
VQRITSRRNAVVARYREAVRGSESLVLLDGAHLVQDAIGAGLVLQHALVAADALDDPDMRALVTRLQDRGVSIADGSASVMDAVSPVRSSSPVVALAERPRQASALYVGAEPLVVVLCDVQDPGNVGAIIRVAEAAGAAGVVLAGHCADPFGWKALRAAMGSALRMTFAAAPSAEAAVADATRHGAIVAATVPRGGAALFDADLTGSLVVLIGGEGPGLPAAIVDAADRRITIPMDGAIESLNAAVAAAVVLYEAVRQRRYSTRGPGIARAATAAAAADVRRATVSGSAPGRRG